MIYLDLVQLRKCSFVGDGADGLGCSIAIHDLLGSLLILSHEVAWEQDRMGDFEMLALDEVLSVSGSSCCRMKLNE